MKKLFFLLTIVGLISFASCKPKEAKTDTNTADTTQVDTVAVDTVVTQ